MSTLHFQLVTPERTVLNEELDSLTCPTSLGQITILPGHVPLVATLVPGELIARIKDQEEHFIHVAGGFVEIKPDNQIIALADTAEHVAELSEKQSQEAVMQAESRLKEARLSREEYAQVAGLLERHLSRLRVIRKHSHRRTSTITGKGTMDE